MTLEVISGRVYRTYVRLKGSVMRNDDKPTDVGVGEGGGSGGRPACLLAEQVLAGDERWAWSVGD